MPTTIRRQPTAPAIPPAERAASILTPLLVAALTVAAFLPAVRNEYINWDDIQNFADNPRYRSFSDADLHWMFTTFHLGPYQPLSWLSLALDCRLIGPTAAAHHTFNLVYQTLAAITLYFVAVRLLALATRRPRSDARLKLAAAFGALVFAVHPLRVESVAWASERRDVLSGFLIALTVLLYLRAMDRPPGRRAWRLALCVIAYALALLAKAAGMSLPVVLLLLDAWPLRRFEKSPQAEPPQSQPPRRVLLEKIPFVILAIAAAVVAFFGQREQSAFQSLADLSILDRVRVASFGVWFYLFKSIWPAGLRPIYSMPPAAAAAVAAPRFWFAVAGVLIASGLALTQWQKRPWLAVAWFSILALLAPVSGLAQAGPQLAADRYAYLPGMVIGMLAAGALLAITTRAASPSLSFAATAAAAVVVLLLAATTTRQTRFWHNSIALWHRVLAFEPANRFARANLAAAHLRRGEVAPAIEQLEINARNHPDQIQQQISLATTLRQTGRANDSLAPARRAVEIDPKSPEAQRALGEALLLTDRINESVAPLEMLCQLAPNDAFARVRLAEALMRQGKPQRSVELLVAAVQLAPNDPRLFEDVSRIYGRLRLMRQAADAARRGLAVSPNDAALAQRLAWLLATSLDDSVRDGNSALALANKLVEAVPGDCRFLATQAAALGELGRFEEARTVLARAIALCPGDEWIASKGKMMDLMFGSHERFQDVE